MIESPLKQLSVLLHWLFNIRRLNPCLPRVLLVRGLPPVVVVNRYALIVVPAPVVRRRVALTPFFAVLKVVSIVDVVH